MSDGAAAGMTPFHWLPVPFQPLRAVVERVTVRDEIEEFTDEDPLVYWRLRIFNQHDAQLPQIEYGCDDVARVLSMADAFKAAGGVDYTIHGLPQSEE